MAHIVAPCWQRGLDGAALYLEARMLGLEVEALCGHRLRPSRNPENLPTCAECARRYTAKFGPDAVPSSA